MRTIVIGAGISGPAAALALASSGDNRVTVMERRPQNDLWSDSTVAITKENIADLAELGVTVPSLPPGSRSVLVNVDHGKTVCEPQDWTTKFHIVVWGQLHEALIHAGERAGVTYQWRQSGTIPPADLVVHAQGVKYAVHHGKFTYAYRVYRGTLFEDSEPMWVTIHDADKQFVLNIGSTGTQQTWMFYVHEPLDGRVSTEVVTGDHREGLMQLARLHVPEPWRSVITRTRTEIQASPVGDWTMPPILTWLGADWNDAQHIRHVDIGDAIAPVRPHTTAGANLGISEGLRLPSGYWDLWQAETRLAREREIANGIQLGQQWMGR